MCFLFGVQEGPCPGFAPRPPLLRKLGYNPLFGTAQPQSNFTSLVGTFKVYLSLLCHVPDQVTSSQEASPVSWKPPELCLPC